MGCLSSIEAPLSALITIIFLVRSLFLITYKVVESNTLIDEEALDARDMLMPALGIMSLVGICSSRRAFGVFTMLFMLHAFFYSAFHLFHTTAIFIKSFDEPCRFLKAPATGQLTSGACHVMNGFSLVCAVSTMVATALATMAVFLRLTTVIVQLSDMRSMATTRSFDNSMPQLISKKAIETEREEDVETPRRKMGQADIFV